ncbi:uncharacterized protein CYBJADRAFT_169312, partial [Cyberlindnera jadinii NRRL Y-1542]
DDRIRSGRRNKAEMADRVLEKIRCDGVLIMIPTLNTSLRMTPTVLMSMMIQFINNNSGDHGDHRDHRTQCIIQVLKSVAIIAMQSLSILNYHLFVATRTKFYSVTYSKNFHST